MVTRVDILVLEGAFPSSVAILFDVLATANRVRALAGRPPAFAVRAIGSGARRARAFITSDTTDGPPELIVVPGLGLTTAEEVQARLDRPDARQAAKLLATSVEGGASAAAACTGVFLLARAGVLAERRATTTWWLSPLFRELHPDVRLEIESLLVSDGPVTTAGAAMATLDLALALVARHADARLAEACARYLLLDQRHSQSRYMALSYLASANELVARAIRWARGRLADPLSVNDLAAAVSASPRTFARRVKTATGLSPVGLLQRLRVEEALALVETTQLPVEEIARRVGYADGSTLRTVLKRHTGGSARTLRAR